jgi:hypothetical protein
LVPFLFGLGQRRQKKPCKNPHHGDHH